MKILEMTATFGGLRHETLRPGEGFTLIQAPNERGKSTWCAFLRAMLYGFPARDQDKKGHIAEKNRYQPWSGAAMEGTLTLEWKGRPVTLYRGPKGSVPWGAFSAVWTASGDPVDGLTAENCGETLLGVSREVFERTAFVGQGDAFLSPSGELEKRIAALATSGEEEVSTSQAEERLKVWRNRRKSNVRNGIIPKLEAELAQVEGTIARQGEWMDKAQTLQREKESLEGRKAALEERLRAFAALRSAQQSQTRAQAQADYDAAQAQVAALEEKAKVLPAAETLRSAQGDLSYLNTIAANLRIADQEAPKALAEARRAEEEADSDPFFPNQDLHFATIQAQKDHDQVIQLTQKPPVFLWGLAGFLIGGLLCRLATPGFLLDWDPPFWEALNRLDPMGGGLDWMTLGVPFGLLGALLALLVLFFRQRSRKKKAAALLRRYDTQTPEGILGRAADYNQKGEAAQERRRNYQAVEAERNNLLAQKDRLTAQLLELVHTFEPGATDLFGVSAAISRALQLGEKYAAAQAEQKAAEKLLSALPAPDAEAASGPVPAAPPQGDPAQLRAELAQVNAQLAQAAEAHARLQGELDTLGDPAGHQARRDAILEELERRRMEYDALSAAMEALKDADSLLREKFSPAINQKAGEYLSALTGGKYDRAAFTRQFQALAQEAGEPVSRPDLALSGGTAQQLYLAVRLAMCELALPQDDPCPILLDDVLDSFDDRRAGLALQRLLQMAQTRQVILFSCHSREREMLKDKAATLLTLPQ